MLAPLMPPSVWHRTTNVGSATGPTLRIGCREQRSDLASETTGQRVPSKDGAVMKFSHTTLTIGAVVATVVLSFSIAASSAVVLNSGQRIRDDQITAVDLAHQSVTGEKVNSGSLTAVNVTAGTLPNNGHPRHSPRLSCAMGGTCSLGDVGPGDGIVFYDAGSARPWGRYLEAAQVSWGATDPTSEWCSNVNTLVPGGTLTAIGTGSKNTAHMLAHGFCASGAANLVTAYRGGGKANWFLASKDELNALYLARGSVGGLSTGTYYSSSEGGAYGVWGQNFASGNQGGAIKSGLYSIRPVRAF